jgi:hypothetical protein
MKPGAKYTTTIPTVAYIHGLESSSHGRKAQYLKKQFGEGNVKALIQPTFPLNVLLFVWTLARTSLQLQQVSPNLIVASSFGGVLLWYVLLLRLWIPEGKVGVLFLGLPTGFCHFSRWMPALSCTFLFGSGDPLSTVAARRSLNGRSGWKVIIVHDGHDLNAHLHLLPVLLKQMCNF